MKVKGIINSNRKHLSHSKYANTQWVM